MVDEAVMAPVLSQPSLPLPLGQSRRAGLHLSEESLAIAKTRDVPVLGLRFHRRQACARASASSVCARSSATDFEGIEIDSSRGNAFGIPQDAHSVLTIHFVDQDGHPTRQALDRVLTFFRERLLGNQE